MISPPRAWGGLGQLRGQGPGRKSCGGHSFRYGVAVGEGAVPERSMGNREPQGGCLYRREKGRKDRTGQSGWEEAAGVLGH